MNKEFFAKNRKNLEEKMKDNSILVMFAGAAPYKSGDQEYHFSPNRNFYYITGIAEPKIILTISKSNGKVSETVFVEREDPVMAKWVGAAMTVDEAREASGVEDVTYLDKFKETFSTAVTRLEIKRVYLDFERMEFDLPLTPAQSFARDVRERYPHLKLKDIYNDIAELRVIKSDEEVKKISKAIDITKDGIYNIIKNIKPGMKENEVEAYFDFEIKRQGASDFAFNTIAAAGKNATVLHYHANNADVNDGDLMMFDLGAAYDHYNGDISRTFPINGKFTERQKAVYNVVLRTMKEVEKAAKPGISLMGLNEVAKKCLADGCRELGLIKEDSELIKYYFHSVGHYLGLDTHDVGDRNKPMEPGMVITNEPGLYIEEEGIGIRIEDDLLITEDGCINLSKHIIKEFDEIEEFMKNR